MTISVFDPKITIDSPAGSCLHKLLLAASSRYRFELFTAETDLAPSPQFHVRKLLVPHKPVFVESILFTLCSVIARAFSERPALTLSTQGGFPFCDISYAHCCHKLFLTRHRAQITGGLSRRTARFLNHAWCAAMEAIAFRHARLIVVPSRGLGDDLLEAYGTTLEPKLRVIPNPVAFQHFAPPPNYAPPETFTFAFCALGNFDWKGLPLIIRALADVPAGRLLVIGGHKAEIDRCRRLAASLNLDHRISFTGLQRDIRPSLWSANAFVLPSVHETFPLVCLQAAAAGLALIATRLHGLEEILQSGVTGWRVDRSMESLTAAMREAVADPVRTGQMGIEAQRRASQYDEPAFQQRWLSLLAENL